MERGPLQDAKLSKLSEDYVACRMTGGSEGRSPGVDEFMSKYDVQGYPTLLVLSADGALLARDFDRSADGILETMSEAGLGEADFQAFATAAGKSEEVAIWVALAQKYVERRELLKAVDLYRKIASKDDTPYRWRQLIGAQQAAGDVAGALASCDALLKKHDTPQHRQLKATLQLAGGDLDAALATLSEGLDDAGKAALKPRVAGMLLDHIIRLCNEQREFKKAEKVLDKLLADYGDTDAANTARRFADQIRQLAKQE